VDVGRRVRELRVRRGLVIEDLARKTGLSKPYISQVETGKASPSLQTVQKLAQALGVPLTYLFLEDAFACHVTRPAERRAVSFGAPDKLVFFLSAPNRGLEMLLLEIPSGYTAGGRTHSHEGEECHWVLDGTITAVQGDQRFVLAPGDSFHWDGSLPHRIENHGPDVARLLVARTPPGFLNVTFDEARDDRADAGGEPGRPGPDGAVLRRLRGGLDREGGRPVTRRGRSPA
jgi:transcriptional regulator with XRE-family HTH domain